MDVIYSIYKDIDSNTISIVCMWRFFHLLENLILFPVLFITGYQDVLSIKVDCQTEQDFIFFPYHLQFLRSSEKICQMLLLTQGKYVKGPCVFLKQSIAFTEKWLPPRASAFIVSAHVFHSPCSPLVISKICHQNDPDHELREKQPILPCLTSLIVYQRDWLYLSLTDAILHIQKILPFVALVLRQQKPQEGPILPIAQYSREHRIPEVS